MAKKQKTADLSDAEWIAFWTQAGAATDLKTVIEIADKFVDQVGCTRREFVEERQSGRLALAQGRWLIPAAVKAGLLEEPE